jgi:hypothetical protein
MSFFQCKAFDPSGLQPKWGEGWGRWPKLCFPGVWLNGIGDAFRTAVLRVWSSNSLNVTSTPESRRAFRAASFQAFFASACAPELRDALYFEFCPGSR